MDVAVKYCGGCNTSYDRGSMVEALRRDFPDVTFRNAENEAGGDPDLVLIICGCPSVCASHQHLNAKHGKMFTACESDFEAIRKVLAEWREELGT